jgi:hypothetical protein
MTRLSVFSSRAIVKKVVAVVSKLALVLKLSQAVITGMVPAYELQKYTSKSPVQHFLGFFDILVNHDISYPETSRL